MAELGALTDEALARIAASGSLAALDELRVHWLGRKGLLTEQLKGLPALKAAERPAAGARINDAKARIQEAIEQRRAALERERVER